jgi:hypothetical protein
MQPLSASQAARWVLMVEDDDGDEGLWSYVFHLTPDINKEDVEAVAISLNDWLYDGWCEHDDDEESVNVPIGFWGPVVIEERRGDECAVCKGDFEPEEENDCDLVFGNCGHTICGVCARMTNAETRPACPQCRALGELRRFER